MLSHKIYLALLSLILLLGIFLRVYQLDVVPPGLNADEAALGYNAYSLLKTGKDEWGQSFPLVFKSFSDYKPGVYVYLDIPFVALLGLNELSVRLPSIILGILSIFLIYLLSKEIFCDEVIALSTSFLLSISPWHILYSRGAWETNIATFFITLGLLSFLKGIKQSKQVFLKQNKWLYLSIISFILALYSYQSTRVIVPVLGLSLLCFYKKELWNKKSIFPALVGIILLIPFIYLMFNPSGLARFQGISIFSDLGPLNRTNEERGQDPNPNSIESKIFHNKYLAYSNSFIDHYLDHFSPQFLFTKGDSLGRNNIPNMGLLYFFEIFTIVFGFYYLLKKDLHISKIILLWLITAPLAAALTYQTPHALRAHNMVIPLTLISGLGLGVILNNAKKVKLLFKIPVFSIVSIIILFSLSNYLNNYYIVLPQKNALEWEYGFKDVASYISQNQDKYSKIVVTDRYDQPYILLLFYLKYDPDLYHQISKKEVPNSFGFSTIESFDKFEFKKISNEEINQSKGVLLIGSDTEINDERAPLKIINFPNGKPAFKIIGS